MDQCIVQLIPFTTREKQREIHRLLKEKRNELMVINQVLSFTKNLPPVDDDGDGNSSVSVHCLNIVRMSGVEVRRYVGFHPLKTIVEKPVLGKNSEENLEKDSS